MKKKYVISLITCISTIFLAIIIGGSGFCGYLLYMKKVKPVKAFEIATDTIGNYETVKFDIEMNVLYKIDFYGENAILNQTLNSEFSGYGEIDIKNEEMFLDVDMKTKGMKMNLKEIIIDEMLYMKIGSQDWVELSLSEIEESSQTYDIEEIKSEQIWASLDKEQEYEYEGIEVINENETYKYNIKLDREATYDFTNNLAKSFAAGLNAGYGDELLSDEDDINISEIKYAVWVDKSNDLPMKEQVNIDEVSFEINGYGTLIMKDIEMTYIYTSFNEEVDIEKPKIQVF